MSDVRTLLKRCATQQRVGECNLKLAWFAGSLQIRDVLAGFKLGSLVSRPVAAESAAQ